MARPRPSRAVVRASSSTIRPRTEAAVAITDWRRDAVVVRLTRTLQGMVAASARRSADEVVAIGRQLKLIHDRLPRGLWVKWLEDNAGFSRSTASNYIDVAEWAGREAAQFARLKHLGPGKLYVLAGTDPKRVRTLKPGKLVALPGSGKRKTIEDMTPPELVRVVGDFEAPDGGTIAIEKVVRSLRSSVASLGAAADAITDRLDEVDLDLVRDVRAEVAAVLGKLDAALDG